MGAQWDQQIGAMPQNPQKDATRPSKTLRWSVAVALLLPCLGANGEEDDGVKGARGPPSQGQGQGRTGTGQPPAGRKSQCLGGFRAGIRDGLMMDCGGGEGNFSLQCWSPSRHQTFRRVVVPHEVARFGAKRTRRPEPDSSCRAREEWRGPHGGMTDLHSGGNNRWLMDGWAETKQISQRCPSRLQRGFVEGVEGKGGLVEDTEFTSTRGLCSLSPRR